MYVNILVYFTPLSLPTFFVMIQGEHHLELVPLSNESPNHSQDEYVAAENEPNNHLYSLGRFVHTGLHSRRLMVHQSQSTESPAGSDLCSTPPSSNTPLPPRQHVPSSANVPGTGTGGSAVEQGSGSGSDVTSSLQESSVESPTVATSKMSSPSRARASTAAQTLSKTKLVSWSKMYQHL